jgi:hypothetical protein
MCDCVYLQIVPQTVQIVPQIIKRNHDQANENASTNASGDGPLHNLVFTLIQLGY